MPLALHALGVALAPALLGVLAYRLFSFWLTSLAGIALLGTLPALVRSLERAEIHASHRLRGEATIVLRRSRVRCSRAATAAVTVASAAALNAASSSH